MILSWMVAATLLSLLVAVAALAAESTLRLWGRQARTPWLIALAAAIAWPALAPLLLVQTPTPEVSGAAIMLPSVTSTIGAIVSALPTVPTRWDRVVQGALLVLWAIASLLMLVRLAAARRSLAALERSAERAVLDGVPVLVSPTLGPAVVGVREPKVLVPGWMLDLEKPLRALILQHEEEHRRARDPQLLLTVAILLALEPWNLGLWWMVRRLRLAVELDCDARVLRGRDDAERYGRLLLFIAQRQSHAMMAPMLAKSNSHLSRRITVMNAPQPRHRMLRITALSVMTAVTLLGSARYAMTMTAMPARPQQEQSPDTVVTFFSPEGAQPARAANTVVPVYPASLKDARVSGEVLVSFVVDTSGRALDGSLKVVRSTDSLFTQAVRTAVSEMRFVAADYKGRKVRQVVQQTFFFDLSGEAQSALRKTRIVAKPTADPTNRNPMPLTPVVVTKP